MTINIEGYEKSLREGHMRKDEFYDRLMRILHQLQDQRVQAFDQDRMETVERLDDEKERVFNALQRWNLKGNSKF